MTTPHLLYVKGYINRTTEPVLHLWNTTADHRKWPSFICLCSELHQQDYWTSAGWSCWIHVCMIQEVPLNGVGTEALFDVVLS